MGDDDFNWLMGMTDPLSGGYGDNPWSDAISANGPDLSTGDISSPSSPGFLNSLLSGGSGSSGGGGVSSALTSLLGGGGSSSGIGSLLSTLLPYLAIAGGGALSYSNQGRASQQLQDAANNANSLVQGIYGQSQANMQPYQQAGAQAIGQMQNTPYQPMAGQFQTTAPGQAPTLTAPGQVPNMTAPVMNFQASAPTLSLGNLGGNRLKRA